MLTSCEREFHGRNKMETASHKKRWSLACFSFSIACFLVSWLGLKMATVTHIAVADYLVAHQQFLQEKLKLQKAHDNYIIIIL